MAFNKSALSVKSSTERYICLYCALLNLLVKAKPCRYTRTGRKVLFVKSWKLLGEEVFIPAILRTECCGMRVGIKQIVVRMMNELS